MLRESDRASYTVLESAWEAVARLHGARATRTPLAPSGAALLRIDIERPAHVPRIALSAGVHGDEPAATWALLSILRDGLLDDAFGYRIWCCTNPTGYARATRTNEAGDDINRSFSRGGLTPEARAIVAANAGCRFVLSLDLHEDFEASGFYCYEPVVGGRAPYGRSVVRAMDEAGFPVQDLHPTFDLGYPPDDRELCSRERGRCLPNVAAELRYFSGLPYSMYMISQHAERTLTFESPRCLRWEDRIAIHRTAVVALLAELRALAARRGREAFPRKAGICRNAISST